MADRAGRGRRRVVVAGAVALVALVGVLALVAARLGDGGDGVDTAEPRGGSDSGAAPTSAPATVPPTEPEPELSDIEAWWAADPGDAPDCDPSTGRIKIPSLRAPNCVPLWPEGADNGGATHRGVSGQEIVVAVYVGQRAPIIQGPVDLIVRPGLSADEQAEYRDLIVVTFGALFETYGRTVRWELLDASGGASDVAAARADAVRAAEEIGAFAVIGGPANTTAFADELVARQVLCLCAAGRLLDRYDEWSPHVWSGPMSSTQGLHVLVEYLADRLGPGRARFAGSPELARQPRRFGFVWLDTAAGEHAPGAAQLRTGLAAAGIDLAVDAPYVLGTGDRLGEDAARIIERFRTEGVTTVVLASDPFMPIHLTREATAHDYHPEWVVAGFGLSDVAGFARQYDQHQWGNAFGVSHRLPPIDPQAASDAGNLVSWHLGEPLGAYPEYYDWERLFTGIHLAGPELTPATFRDGLDAFEPVFGHQTELGVSYGEGVWPSFDHTGVDDIVELWWDPHHPDPADPAGETSGVYRYTDEARRRMPGDLDGFEGELFDTAGTAVRFTERPTGDAPPRYPRRSGRTG